MPPNAKRRSQKDRSQSTQLEVLEATLRCISRMGYASISLSEVAKEAGVSRGAITHHYGAKLDLAAAAADYFFIERYNRLMALLAGNKKLTLDERLDILGKEFEDLFPVGFEIMVALRTNPDLQARCAALHADRIEEMTQGYERMFPEFAPAASPRLLVGVVAAFFRGAATEVFNSDSKQRYDEMKNVFKAMVRHYVAQELSGKTKP
jgi:AcrR family transcriptional regulator